MNQEVYKSFETKTGFCHVFTDKIVLSKDLNGTIKVVANNNIKRIFLLHGLVSIYNFYMFYNSINEKKYFFSILFLVIGLIFTFGIFNSLNNSTTPIIFRNSIKEVVFIKAKPYITRAYFEVYFTDENNSTKKRLIMLPGSFSNGKSETEKALKIFKEEGLIS